MMRRPALILGAGVLPMLVGCALMREQTRALGNASRWQHGVGSVPDSVRVYMAANRWATDMIEDALLGRFRAPAWFDTVFAVYWLSDSGRRKYLGTLRHFALHADHTVATFAIYGLARHAGEPAVRARLLQVDATAPTLVRNNMVGLLSAVNDSAARSLLRVISRRDLRPYTTELMEMALSAPALPKGMGRVPCLRGNPGPWPGKCPE